MFINETERMRGHRPDTEGCPEQCGFFLDDDSHERFLALLETPPAPSDELIELMRRTPRWER